MKIRNFIIKNKSFCFFAFLALLIILTAVFAPVITGGVSPSEAVLRDALKPPGKEHIFGTDKLGRDIFTRVIYGARTSLVAAFSVVILIFVLGTVLGVLAGYFGGWADAVIMRIADLMVSFPGMVFAMAIETCPEPGAENPESGLCGSRRGYRFQDLFYTAEIYDPQRYPHFGHYRRHRYRRYDAGTGRAFLPWLRRKGAYA